MYASFNTVSDHPHIPQQAFLFVPQRSKDPKINDDFRIVTGKNVRRLMFQGWAQQTYSQDQLKKLQQFQDYLKRKSITIDLRWNRSWKLRFLLSVGCDNKKCIEAMEIFANYRTTVQNITMSPVATKYLNAGVFYVSGRDSHYRPILIFDVDKIIKMEMKQQELIQTQTYFFEYVIRNFLIPGQVQNWVAVIDVAQTSLLSLVSTMKKSFTFLSDTYRSRMFVCYICRIPFSLSILWGIVKKFLEQETVNKINFFDDQAIPVMADFCNPTQYQVKFGGSLPNLTQFWPPKEHSKQYKIPKYKPRYLTREQYTEYYDKGTLFDTKFHQENLIKAASNETSQNLNLQVLRNMQREMKILMETNEEETVNYQRDIQPYSTLKAPLNYFNLIKQDQITKATLNGKK